MAVRKTAKGASLKRWFKEEWKDEKGNACGSTKTRRLKNVGHQKELALKRLRRGGKCRQLKKRKRWPKRKERGWVKEPHL